MNELADVPAFMFALFNFPSWEIVIKSTIVIALAAFGCRSLHRQSAAWRHRVWVCGLAASLVVPIVCLSLPQFTLPLLPFTMDASSLVKMRDSRRPSPISTAASSLPGSARGIITNGVSPRRALDTKSSTTPSADASAKVRKSEQFPSTFAGNPGLEQVFVVCWLLGTMVGATLLLISLARQSIWLWRMRRIEDDDWVNSVTTAARTLGLKRPIVALQSDAACIPTVVGVLSPRLVVPSNWRTWSLSQRRCILLHELAHVKRCDVSAQLLGASHCWRTGSIRWSGMLSGNCELFENSRPTIASCGQDRQRATMQKNCYALCGATALFGPRLESRWRILPASTSECWRSWIKGVVATPSARDLPSSCRALWASFAVCWAR